MSSKWIIDGDNDCHAKLHEAKQHLVDAPKSELKTNYRNGGYIYHIVNGEVIGGVSFVCKLNGALRFSRTEKSPW